MFQLWFAVDLTRCMVLLLHAWYCYCMPGHSVLSFEQHVNHGPGRNRLWAGAMALQQEHESLHDSDLVHRQGHPAVMWLTHHRLRQILWLWQQLSNCDQSCRVTTLWLASSASRHIKGGWPACNHHQLLVTVKYIAHQSSEFSSRSSLYVSQSVRQSEIVQSLRAS